jgi:hypothetical protein
MTTFLRSARARRVIPAVLSGGMLVVIVAAALAPNTGAIPAQSSCQYGNCGAGSSGIPLWLWATIGGVILAAILAAVFLLYFRRRGGGAAGRGRLETEVGPAGGGGAAPPGAMEVPEYVETESDVGVAPTVLPPAAPAGGAPPAEGAPGEPNIDSLMDELDRISGEMQKKDARTRPPPPEESDESR